MFKKAIAALLVILLSVSMAACTSATAPSASAPTTSGTGSTTGSAPTTTTTTPATTKPEEPTFEEIVLAENDNITVKITAIEENSIFGYTLKVFLENKTDKELMFTVDDVSVNGFMCDPFWATSVAGGKKSNSSIFWSESNFEENGIEEVEEITFTLRVYDSNDILADDLLEKDFTIKP